MATFQCQSCGNLHGAPVEACGICGQPTVTLVPDDTQPPQQPPAPGALPSSTFGAAAPPTPSADQFVEAAKELFDPFMTYVKERNAEGDARHAELDAKEEARRDALNHAKLELYGQTTTLVEKLFELVEAATAYVQNRTPIGHGG